MSKPDVFTWQTPWELDTVLPLVAEHAPDRILEIGIWDGGTLWHWLYFGNVVVGIDIEIRHRDVFQGWADELDTSLELISGDSRDSAVVEQAAQFAPYDLLFIDADHSYAGVSADWQNYSPLVRPGGLVLLHDIMGDPGDGVPRLWSDVKSEGWRTVEIMGELDSRGIGAVWVEP